MAAGANISWWAVLQDTERTGRKQIIYVQATSRLQAGENNPGTTVLGGPYKSEAAAEKAHPQGSSGSVKAAAGQKKPPTLSDKPVNPLAGIDELGAVLDAAYKALTDGKMWRSLGWMVLGLILMVMGLRMWIGKSALPSLPSVVPVPV